MRKSQTLDSARQLFTTAKFLVSRRLARFSLPLEPHFDPEASQSFEHLLGNSRFYLEFGCGGSTVRAAELNIPTISVESDRYFARRMAQALGPSSTVEIVYADIGMTREWGWPLFGSSTPSRRAKWSSYSAAPWERIPKDVFPDFILIDGRFRRACALQAARHAAAVGSATTIMFDDYYNAGREDYRSVERFLGSPRRVGRAAFFHLDVSEPGPTCADRELIEANSDPR